MGKKKMGIRSTGEVSNLDLDWSSNIDYFDAVDIANMVQAAGGRSRENVDSVSVIERQGENLAIDKIFHD